MVPGYLRAICAVEARLKEHMGYPVGIANRHGKGSQRTRSSKVCGMGQHMWEKTISAVIPGQRMNR